MTIAAPDPPARHHLPFDRPFDKLAVPSNVEGLMALSGSASLTVLSKSKDKAEGLRCLRSLLLAAYRYIRLSRRSLAPPKAKYRSRVLAGDQECPQTS